MTTTDPLTLPHVLALLRAVDNGDDEALLVLADALEEVGDARAAGLRQSVAYYPFQHNTTDGEPIGWGWKVGASFTPSLEVFERLAGYFMIPGFPERYYPTRSAAFLALAAAINEVCACCGCRPATHEESRGWDSARNCGAYAQVCEQCCDRCERCGQCVGSCDYPDAPDCRHYWEFQRAAPGQPAY